jgi:hypothetical protein
MITFCELFLQQSITFCEFFGNKVHLFRRRSKKGILEGKRKKVYKNKMNNMKPVILLSNYFNAPPPPRQTAALWPTLLHFRQMIFDFAGGRLFFGPALGVVDPCPPLAAAAIAKRSSLSSPVALLALNAVRVRQLDRAKLLIQQVVVLQEQPTYVVRQRVNAQHHLKVLQGFDQGLKLFERPTKMAW